MFHSAYLPAGGGHMRRCASTETAGGRTVALPELGDYIDPAVIPMFEEENPDIKINMTTVPSNEEMYVIATTEGDTDRRGGSSNI